MPTIYDNQQNKLLDALTELLPKTTRADFCVGYFHLRGWESLMKHIDIYKGTDDSCCRLLVGMHRPPQEVMKDLQRGIRDPNSIDGATILNRRREAVEYFREQIEFGLPNDHTETTLRKLAEQLRAKKVRVKLFLRHTLHAKLYLLRRYDTVTPLVGYLGSSNLTLAGLKSQGELNVDVVDQDAANKLLTWFESHWNDEFCLDISEELAKMIEQSWAGTEFQEIENLPYLIYLKMAYHLSEDARVGETNFKLPDDLQSTLLDFQISAVQLAAQLLYRNNGVILGDVVGLGKTLMAIALARVFQEAENGRTLIICPPKLEPMWEWHHKEYNLLADTLSLGKVRDLEGTRRYRTLIIDESHNLRNRNTRTYQAITGYIEENEPRVILLSATPYNKHYEDIGSQLRLFLPEGKDLRIKPEKFFQNWYAEGKNDADFSATFQALPRSIDAFEKSEHADDWRELMRLFMVRRTRSFIIKNYAKLDEQRGRSYVILNNQRKYFPVRKPHTLNFDAGDVAQMDPYSRLYSENVVEKIENLFLPRYGLSIYLKEPIQPPPTSEEQKIISDLNKAGKRLIGFCRTNLFKRLESSGYSFLESLERHILRNMVTVHAIENGLPIPIGAQDTSVMDTNLSDVDAEYEQVDFDTTDDVQVDEEQLLQMESERIERQLNSFRAKAQSIYGSYVSKFKNRFRWISPRFFTDQLVNDLLSDATALLSILGEAGDWDPERDNKLKTLYDLIEKKHALDKILIFTQFSDTANYLHEQLAKRGVLNIAAVTSATNSPVEIARRFSPNSNGGLKPNEQVLRVLIATDILSEGQNLQDCHIVVNYDLPWAIIRLVQRAGRVDRIGQQHDTIHVYSFSPAEGVEKIIRLRERLIHRLQTNQEVIGSDESLIGEKTSPDTLRDLFTEKAKALEDDSSDQEIDLTSLALQVWNSADEKSRKAALALPKMIYGTREHSSTPNSPPGVISYLRVKRGNEKDDLMVRVNENGEVISHSISQLFQQASCPPNTFNVQPPLANHWDLMKSAVSFAIKDSFTSGGHLGTNKNARRRLYELLKEYSQNSRFDLYTQYLKDTAEKMMSLLWHQPLKEGARRILTNLLKTNAPIKDILEAMQNLHDDGKLVQDLHQTAEPEMEIECSIGLKEVV